MADRRKKKKKEVDIEEEKPSKTEYDIAKYLRNKLPEKKTFLLGNKVDYFIASKAIDCLLDSKWAKKSKNQNEPLFTSRESVVAYMETMLLHKFFHRARKIIVIKDSSNKKKKNEDDNGEDTKEKKKEKKQKEKLKTDKDKDDKEKSKSDKDKDKDDKDKEKDTEKKKDKKKVKFDMHLEQIFVDGNEPYVWIYDPIPLKAWFIGFGLVIGAVAICLFPLWPKTVRTYVYYLSVAAAVFLFFIISLTVVRLVVFVVVWLLTFGKHHLWLLPNLTEDVGFFESFWPLYDYKYKGSESKEKDDEDKEKEKKENKDEKTKDGEKSTNKDIDIAEENNSKIKEDTENSDGSDTGSQANSRGSNRSTGTSNGFEILDDEEAIDVENKKEK